MEAADVQAMPPLDVPRMLHVLLVEDSSPVRARIRSLIEESNAAEVVGEADSVAAACLLLQVAPVDAVVLDLHLGDGDGCEVLAQVKRTCPDCLVIVLTSFSDAADRLRCLELGADHFFDKTREFERVPEVLADLGRRLAPPA